MVARKERVLIGALGEMHRTKYEEEWGSGVRLRYLHCPASAGSHIDN
jgi:hypothetical protein